MNRAKLLLSAASLLVAPLLTTGCSTSFSATDAAVTAQARMNNPLAGQVMGGQQPIVGASIYLMDVGNGGYGTAATSLLTTGSTSSSASQVYFDASGNGYVVTSSSGGFNITGSYSCNHNSDQVYLVSKGGNAGAGANGAAILMSPLGTCGNLPNQSFVSINELTTVAGVYALLPFIGTDVFHIGASSSNLIGVTNAMTTAANLVSPNYGYVQTGNSNVVYPTGKIFTLANIIASCVNSTASKTPCTGLFSKSYSGTVTDVFGMLVQIATNPQFNVGKIYNQAPATSAFGNNLAAAPSDWSLAVSYSGGGLGSATNNNSSALQVAIDSNGGAWVTLCGVSCGETQADSLVEINPYTGTASNGFILSGTSGFGTGSVHNSKGLAIDQSNNVYVANDVAPNATSGFSSVPSISIFDATGKELLNSPVTSSYFTSPMGIVINANGTALVADAGSQNVYSVSSGGVVNPNYITPSSSFTQLVAPSALAIDTNGDILVDDTGGSSTVIYAPGSGNTYTQVVSKNGAASPGNLALTSSHQFWQLSTSSANLYELNESGGLVTSTALTKTNTVYSLAVDGSGNVFTAVYCNNAKCGASTLSVNNASGASVTYSTGLMDASLSQPSGVAVDASGNVWLANSGTGAVTEFIGNAAPVVTPISQSLSLASFGTRP